MSQDQPAFRMGRLDHVHIRVPDRAQAAQWYAQHLRFGDGIDPVRYWPRDLFDQHRRADR